MKKSGCVDKNAIDSFINKGGITDISDSRLENIL